MPTIDLGAIIEVCLMLIVVYTVGFLCWNRCFCCSKSKKDAKKGGKDKKKNKGDDFTADVKVKLEDKNDIKIEHLTQRKDMSTAYFLCLTGGLIGAHHFYLDRPAHGVAALVTLNFCFVGFIFDLVFMLLYVRTANSRTAPVAKHGGAIWRLLSRAPFCVVLWVCVFAVCFHGIPKTFDAIGLIDLVACRAGTDTNPYVVLGMKPGGTQKDLQSATIRMQSEVQSKCGNGRATTKQKKRECKEMREEIHRSIQFVAGEITKSTQTLDHEAGMQRLIDEAGEDWSNIWDRASEEVPERAAKLMNSVQVWLVVSSQDAEADASSESASSENSDL